jgi:hypothetical protein
MPRFEDQELPFIALQIGVVAMEAGMFKIGEVGLCTLESS